MEDPVLNHGPSPEVPLPPKTSTEQQMEHTPLPSRPNVAARHAKRLTLNFPIATPLNIRPEQASPSVATPAAEASPGIMSPGQFVPDASLPGEPTTHEPTDFLTAIASQERKVLELKEELSKAEAELASLKKQWVRSERQKKQTEISHHAEPMRPIRSSMEGVNGLQSPRNSEVSVAATPTTAGMDAVPAQIRRSKELERRNSIRTATKGETLVSANGRRVFAGSKHTRTLSLLSPDMGVVKQSFPMPSPSDSTKSSESQATRHPRSATLPSVERTDAANTLDVSEKPSSENEWRRSLPPPSGEALLRTGRQMASDLKEGLWTFLEDIRQATVGEEGISATRSRTLQPPSSTSRSRSGQRSERSVTPVRRGNTNGESFGRTSSSSSLSKDASTSRKLTGNKNSSSSPSPPAGTEDSFWSEFGVDTPGQKLKPKEATAVAASNIPNGQKEYANSKQLEVKKQEDDDDEDDWNNWDTPQPEKKSHTPSSSRSTVISKMDQSPSTQLSSPRTSASFGERNTDEAERARTDSGIPWPALSKFTASQLTRTASSLMDEWEKSLTSASSSAKNDQDDWEAF